MSTLRYTAGGDYDSINNANIAPGGLPSPFTKLSIGASGDGSEFDVYGANGNGNFLPADSRTDGIYADFSDNMTGAYMQGGMMGDVLIGGSGNDFFNEGELGNDSVNGNGGDDVLSFADSAKAVFSDIMAPSISYDQGTIRFQHIETIIGSSKADTLIAEQNSGITTLEGRGGGDSIAFFVPDGTVSFEHSPAGVHVTLNGAFTTATTVGGDTNDDQVYNAVNIIGSASHDILTGDAQDNMIRGGGGRDAIAGGDGDDVIVGGTGSDHVSGGAGADIFVYAGLGDLGGASLSVTPARTNAVAPSHSHHDVIGDFSGAEGAAQGDRIDLSGIASFTFETGDRFVAGDGAEIYAASGKHGFQVVYGDVNGDGVIDFKLRVTADGPLSADDFILGRGTAAAHPAASAFHPEMAIDAHPAFVGGLHAIEHLAIA